MKHAIVKVAGKRVWLLALTVFTCALVGIPGLATAAGPALSSAQPTTQLAVTNNSSREISHLYLSPTDRNAWGPDLLNETTIRNGQTVTFSDVSCGANEIKVVAEDKDGCFTYGVVGCAQSSTSWTITNDTPRDCGN